MLNNIAKNWNEVTLYQYLEINDAISSWENNSYESASDYYIDILSILQNTTPDDPIFEDMEFYEVYEIIGKRRWLFSRPPSVNVTAIEGFNLIPMNKIKLGEFIDCEYFLENEDQFKILPILFKKTETDKWGNLIYEPYIYDLDERYEIFLDQPVTKMIGAIDNYITFKEQFLSSYENLFQIKESSLDESDELVGREKLDAKKEEMEQKSKSKWSWESILLGLTNNDVTKFDSLLNTSLILVFNTLSAKKVLGI